MRWKCPHCQMGLSVARTDDKREWLFTRCIHCGGFAVLKQSRSVSMRIGEDTGATQARRQIIGQDTRHIPAPSKKPVVRRQTRKPATPPPFRHSSQKPTPPRFNPSAAVAVPEPLPEIESLVRKRNPVIQVAIGAAGAIAILSGLMLYQRGKEILSRNDTKRIERKIAHKIDIQMKHEKDEMVNFSSASPVVEAPKVEKAKPKHVAHDMRVEAVVAEVKLRSGPGLQYPIVGIAAAKEQYRVLGFRDRWFHVVPLDPSPTKPKHAWVRNDVIQSVRSSSGAENVE